MSLEWSVEFRNSHDTGQQLCTLVVVRMRSVRCSCFIRGCSRVALLLWEPQSRQMSDYNWCAPADGRATRRLHGLRWHDVIEAHCYIVNIDELIVSRYVAESITTDARRFGHIGLCQLHMKLFCMQLTICMQLTKANMAETSVYLLCYVRICSRSVHPILTRHNNVRM